jgi:hypothetical protein
MRTADENSKEEMVFPFSTLVGGGIKEGAIFQDESVGSR